MDVGKCIIYAVSLTISDSTMWPSGELAHLAFPVNVRRVRDSGASRPGCVPRRGLEAGAQELVLREFVRGVWVSSLATSVLCRIRGGPAFGLSMGWLAWVWVGPATGLNARLAGVDNIRPLCHLA